MSVMAFVQARMGSTRLPGKILEPLAGVPSLLRVLERLARVKGLDGHAVLTSTDPRDDPVASLCESAGAICIRGSETDVLDRYHTAAVQLAPTHIVRVTADCPLLDPEVVGALLELFARHDALAYAAVATGALPRERGLNRFPDGLDAEIVTSEALSTAWREATEPYDREHVTPFIWRQPHRFPAAMLECEVDHGAERWTIDHPEDLELVRELYSRLGANGRAFGWREVLAELERDPTLRQINAGHRAHPARPAP
jgi:spore coat polysaccharide biosynthesis protein SpsF